MDLIIALKLNGKACFPNATDKAGYVSDVSGELKWNNTGKTPNYHSITRLDWQPWHPCKEVKKVVIENVKIQDKCCDANYWIHITGEKLADKDIFNKPPMKMILEWEE